MRIRWEQFFPFLIKKTTDRLSLCGVTLCLKQQPEPLDIELNDALHSALHADCHNKLQIGIGGPWLSIVPSSRKRLDALDNEMYDIVPRSKSLCEIYMRGAQSLPIGASVHRESSPH